ncbi:MAG: hypothetical protein AAGF07_03125 [Patescibacteria group bacterium]
MVILSAVLLGLGVFFRIEAQAQGIEGLRIIDIGDLDGDGNSNTIGDLLRLITNFLFSLAPAVAVLVITYGGFKYFQGGLDGKADGLKAIQAGVIGLAVVLLANAIGGSGGFVEQLFANDTINSDPLIDLINTIVDILIGLSSAVATLVIVYGGYKYFQGGVDGKADGLKTIQNGVIGLAVVLLAGAIRNFVITTIGTAVTDINSIPEAFGNALAGLLGNVTGVLVGLAVTVTVLVIVYGGYQYFFGGFNGKAEGRANIEKGVTGLVVVLLANFITSTVADLFGDVNTAADFANIPGLAGTVIGGILGNATDTLLLLAGLFAVLVIIYGGYQFYISTIPEQKANGKATITNGIIGLIVVIIARPIVTLIQVTLNATDPLSSTPDTLEFNTAGITFVVKNVVSNMLIPISSVLTVFFLVLGAYYYITANGSSEQVKKAQQAIQNAVIGFVIVLISVSVVQLIIYFVRPEDFSATDSVIPGTDNLNQTTDFSPGGGNGDNVPAQPSLPTN